MGSDNRATSPRSTRRTRGKDRGTTPETRHDPQRDSVLKNLWLKQHPDDGEDVIESEEFEEFRNKMSGKSFEELESMEGKRSRAALSPDMEQPSKRQRRSRSRSPNPAVESGKGKGSKRKRVVETHEPSVFDTIDPKNLHAPSDMDKVTKIPSRIPLSRERPELPAPTPVRSFLVPSLNCVMTSDWNVVREDMRSTQLHQRIEEMKKKDIWSFKQMQKHKPPPRTKTHWDWMLDEMKWMAEDFRQERRWKIATAFVLARWCAEWVEADEQGRKALQCKVQPPKERSLEELLQVGEEMRSRWQGKIKDVEMQEAEAIPTTVSEAPPPVTTEATTTDSTVPLQTATTNPPPVPVPVPTPEPEVNPRVELPESLRNPLRELEPSVCASSILTYVDVPNFSLGKEEVYGPPRPDDSIYEDELLSLDRVVPVSRFMATRARYSDVRWDNWGRDVTLLENQDLVKKLREVESTSSPYAKPTDYTGPFGTREEREGRMMGDPLGVPKPRENSTRMQPQWHPDEDDLLLSFGKAYQQNWPLVAEWLASNQVIRTPWECYERYKQLEAEGRPRRIPKLDPRRQMEKHRNTFEYVRRVSKRRDPRPLPNIHPARKINLQPHETHAQSQLQAGVNPNYTSMDLSALKETSDRKGRTQETATRGPFVSRASGQVGLVRQASSTNVKPATPPAVSNAGVASLANAAGAAAVAAVRAQSATTPPANRPLQAPNPAEAQAALLGQFLRTQQAQANPNPVASVVRPSQASLVSALAAANGGNINELLNSNPALRQQLMQLAAAQAKVQPPGK